MRSCSLRARSIWLSRLLHVFLKPLADLQVVDVHELRTDVTAIRLAKVIDELTQGALRFAGQVGAVNEPIEICIGEAVVFRREFRRFGVAAAKGVKVGQDMTPHPIIANQLIDAMLERGEGFAMLTRRWRLDERGCGG